MTWDWWQTDPTYVIDDPPKGFECPPILNFVGQMTRDNGLRAACCCGSKLRKVASQGQATKSFSLRRRCRAKIFISLSSLSWSSEGRFFPVLAGCAGLGAAGRADAILGWAGEGPG